MTSPPKPTQEGRKRTTKFVGAWVPDEMISLIDSAIVDKDLDRSKFVRAAIKEKLARYFDAAQKETL